MVSTMNYRTNPRRLTLLTDVHAVPGYDWATTRWLRRQVDVGTLPSYKVSGRVLVDLEDIDAMVEAGRREKRAS